MWSYMDWIVWTVMYGHNKKKIHVLKFLDFDLVDECYDLNMASSSDGHNIMNIFSVNIVNKYMLSYEIIIKRMQIII